jgi:hypothetical protein
MSHEDATNATVQASLLAGLISPEAMRIIVSGDHAQFASSRALVGELLERHKFKPGKRVSQLDDRSRALNRVRELRGEGHSHDAILATLRAEFPTIRNFSAVMAKKPPGREVKRANELKVSNEVTD